MTDFHQTIMGRKFYDSDIPAIVKQLTRAADAMDRIADAMDRTPKGFGVTAFVVLGSNNRTPLRADQRFDTVYDAEKHAKFFAARFGAFEWEVTDGNGNVVARHP